MVDHLSKTISGVVPPSPGCVPVLSVDMVKILVDMIGLVEVNDIQDFQTSNTTSIH